MQQVPSDFTKYILTEEEELRAQQLSAETIAQLQNYLADACEEIVKNCFREGKPTLEEREKICYQQGQADILRFLISQAKERQYLQLEENIDPQN